MVICRSRNLICHGMSDGITQTRRSNGQKIDLKWSPSGQWTDLRKAPDHRPLHAHCGPNLNRAVSPLTLNRDRLLATLAERLLFDLVSLHNIAWGGDRQDLPISIHKETVDLAVMH